MSSPNKEEDKKVQHEETWTSSEANEKANPTREAGTNCDLYMDFTDEDERLLQKIELTEHQLKLKETDKNAFWKSVSETIRVDLSDALADNEDVILLILKT